MRLRRVALAGILTFAFGMSVPTSVSAHNWTPDDGCKPGLSSDGYFWAAGPAAYWGVWSGGWANCHMSTYTNTSGIQNWAEWYLPISSSYNHLYSVYAYISNAGPSPYTTQAIYRGYANGHRGGVTYSYVLDQRSNQGGFCYSLGQDNYYGSNGGMLDAIDYNSYGDGYLYVDLVCFYR